MQRITQWLRRIRDSVAVAVLVGTLVLVAVNLALDLGMALVMGWNFDG